MALDEATEAYLRQLLAAAPPLPDTVLALLRRDFAQIPDTASTAKAA